MASEGALFKPVAGMFVLTGATVTLLILRRVIALETKKISIKEFRTLDVSKLDYNNAVVTKLLANLFETPVLFYTLCAFITMLKKTDDTHLLLAKVYLWLRVAHAAVFLTFNNPNVRVVPFLLSLGTLGTMTLRLYKQIQ